MATPAGAAEKLLKLKHLKNLVKHRVILIYSQVGGPDSLFLTPAGVREFVKDGITVIANWPTLTGLLLEEIQNRKEWLKYDKKRINQKRKENVKHVMANAEIFLGTRPKRHNPNELIPRYDSQLNEIEKTIKKIKNKKDGDERFRLVSDDYLNFAEQIVNENYLFQNLTKVANQIIKRESTNPLIL